MSYRPLAHVWAILQLLNVSRGVTRAKPEMPINRWGDKEQRSATLKCFVCDQNEVLGRGAYVAATADAPMMDAEYTCGVCDGTCAFCESPEDLMTEGIAKGLLCERCWSDEVPKWKDIDARRRQWWKTLTNPTTAKNRKFVTTYVSKLHGVVSKELSQDAQLKLALRVYCKRGRGGQAGNNKNLGAQKVRTPKAKVEEHVFLGIARTCLREVSASRAAARFSFDLLTKGENQGLRKESNELEAIFLRKYQALERLTDNEEKLTGVRVLDVSRNLAVAIASRTLGPVIISKRTARMPSYSEEPERFVERVIEISSAWLENCDAHRNLESSGRTDESEEGRRRSASSRRELKRRETELREKREAASKKPKRAPPRERRAPPYVPPVSRPNYSDPSTEVTVAGFGEMLAHELQAAVRARGGRLRVELGRNPNSDECKKWLREYIERGASSS